MGFRIRQKGGLRAYQENLDGKQACTRTDCSSTRTSYRFPTALDAPGRKFVRNAKVQCLERCFTSSACRWLSLLRRRCVTLTHPGICQLFVNSVDGHWMRLGRRNNCYFC